VTTPDIIEPISARGWPASEVAALGAWRLHAAAGFSGRINTCWALGTPDRPLAAAVEAAEAWYAARGLAPRFKLIDGEVGEVAELLAAKGYAPDTPTLTMTGPLAGADDAEVRIESHPGPGYRSVFADAAFGEAADARERLDALARIPAPRGYALILSDGAPAAIGACAVGGDWAGFIGMRTAPAHRRKGLARRVFRALAAFGRAAGATQGYLQVEEPNASAVGLYRAEGFESRYRYHYWTMPSA
jgi:ribosomal protein S18 acetylase RimI-like enzyme